MKRDSASRSQLVRQVHDYPLVVVAVAVVVVVHCYHFPHYLFQSLWHISIHHANQPQVKIRGILSQRVNFYHQLCVSVQSKDTRTRTPTFKEDFHLQSLRRRNFQDPCRPFWHLRQQRQHISYFFCCKFRTADICCIASAKSLLNHEIYDEVNMHTINSPFHKF